MFGDVLCLTHDEFAPDAHGNRGVLREGMRVLAFDSDMDADGNPDKIIATGEVARPPDWLTHTGSGWVLQLDERGVRHESDDGPGGF